MLIHQDRLGTDIAKTQTKTVRRMQPARQALTTTLGDAAVNVQSKAGQLKERAENNLTGGRVRNK